MGQYVLARYTGGNWIDSSDQVGVTCVVVKRVPVTFGGNNQRDFKWQTFGAMCLFGQEVDYWMPIPPIEAQP